MKKLLLIWLTFCTLTLSAQLYHKSLIQLPVSQSDTVSAYLLVPDHVPAEGCPAVVACHDHGARFTIGKEKLTSPLDTASLFEAQEWVRKCYDGQFVADSLASRGYVVLVMDALYWGERRWSRTMTNKELKNAQPAFYAEYLEQTGQVWFETILADDKACVDYLLSLPFVNPKRVGVWGFSMGAYRAWQLAAEDERIAFCAAANWMTTLAERGGQLPDVSGYSMYRPRKEKVDYGQIVSSIAPRPMLLQYGAQDRLFPYGEHVTTVWDALTIQVLEGEHRFTQQHWFNLLDWLQQL